MTLDHCISIDRIKLNRIQLVEYMNYLLFNGHIYFPIFIRVMVRLTSLIVIFFSCWPDFDQISLEFFSVILLLWVIQREKCKDKKEMNKHTYSPLVWNSHSSTYLKRNRMKLNCKSSYSVLINIIHYSFYTQSFQIFLTILFSSLFIFFHFILVSFFFLYILLNINK